MGLDLPDFDLTDEAQVEARVTDEYALVLNCSAYTNVDGAETDEPRATAINGHGVTYLARACAARGVPLVHYSTDYVLSGNASAPYPVDGELSPLGRYGRSKALGELAPLFSRLTGRTSRSSATAASAAARAGSARRLHAARPFRGGLIFEADSKAEGLSSRSKVSCVGCASGGSLAPRRDWAFRRFPRILSLLSRE